MSSSFFELVGLQFKLTATEREGVGGRAPGDTKCSFMAVCLGPKSLSITAIGSLRSLLPGLSSILISGGRSSPSGDSYRTTEYVFIFFIPVRSAPCFLAVLGVGRQLKSSNRHTHSFMLGTARALRLRGFVCIAGKKALLTQLTNLPRNGIMCHCFTRNTFRRYDTHVQPITVLVVEAIFWSAYGGNEELSGRTIR